MTDVAFCRSSGTRTSALSDTQNMLWMFQCILLTETTPIWMQPKSASHSENFWTESSPFFLVSCLTLLLACPRGTSFGFLPLARMLHFARKRQFRSRVNKCPANYAINSESLCREALTLVCCLSSPRVQNIWLDDLHDELWIDSCHMCCPSHE